MKWDGDNDTEMRLRTVPQDLGEVYQLIYEFVRAGAKLPRYGRWMEGANA